MMNLAPKSTNVKILAPKNRKYSAWEGGSLLAKSSTFSELSVSKNEHDEQRPAFVYSSYFESTFTKA